MCIYTFVAQWLFFKGIFFFFSSLVVVQGSKPLMLLIPHYMVYTELSQRIWPDKVRGKNRSILLFFLCGLFW